MKSTSTIRRHQRDLRRLIDNPESDDVLKRIAYAMECAVTRTSSKTVGWPGLGQEAVNLAKLLPSMTMSRAGIKMGVDTYD